MTSYVRTRHIYICTKPTCPLFGREELSDNTMHEDILVPTFIHQNSSTSDCLLTIKYNVECWLCGFVCCWNDNES